MRPFGVALHTALTVGACFVVVACGDAGGGGAADPNPVGAASQRIRDGSNDSDVSPNNAAVRLFSNGTLCSGTLITPLRVMTANHCINGATFQTNNPLCTDPGTTSSSGWGMGNPPTVGFGAALSQHGTQTVSGISQLSALGNATTLYPNGSCATPLTVDQDVAMVNLAARPNLGTGMGTWNVLPVHPWEKNFTCQKNFKGFFLGWGNVQNGGPTATIRQFFNGDVDRGQFWYSYHSDANPYHGTLPGDSGGPLMNFNQAMPLVCGVSAVFGFSDITGTGYSGWAMVDRSGNDTFIKQTAWDFQHNVWFGECGGADGDGDGVPTACDNCPKFANLDQSDLDGDGLGDVCDNCYLTQNPGQTDANFAAEVELSGPPPGMRTAATLTTAWPGDSCDANPVTTVVETGVNYEPPLNDPDTKVRRIACDIYPGDGCDAAPPISTTCSVARENTLDAASMVATGDQIGWTRAAFCKCPDGKPPALCVSTYHCDRTNLTALDTGWHPMTLADANGHAALTDSGGYLQADYKTPSKPSLSSWGWRYWDDLALGAYVRAPDPNDPGNEFASAKQAVFSGLIWTWVSVYGPNGDPRPPVSDPPTGSAPQQRVRQFVAGTGENARVHVFEAGGAKMKGPPCVSLTRSFKIKLSQDDCPMCTDSAIVNFLSDPDAVGTATLTSPGFLSARAVDVIAPEILSAMVGGATDTVFASDEAGAWTGTRSGVQFDASTGLLSGIVRELSSGKLVVDAPGTGLMPGVGGVPGDVTAPVPELLQRPTAAIDALPTSPGGTPVPGGPPAGTHALEATVGDAPPLPVAAVSGKRGEAAFFIGAEAAGRLVVLHPSNRKLPGDELTPTARFGARARFAVPQQIPLLTGKAGTGVLLLTPELGSVAHRCTYRGNGKPPPGAPNLYVFQSCNNGTVAGDVIDADTVSARLVGGTTEVAEVSLPTMVRSGLRLYDLKKHTTRIQPIVNGTELHHPIAATYRPEGDEYDVLDDAVGADGAPVMRLVRIQRGIAGDLLGEWPRTDPTRRFGLSTGDDGTLVLSSWTDSDHLVAVLSTGTVDLPGVPGDGDGDPSLRLIYLSGQGDGALAVSAQSSRIGLFLERQVGTTLLAPERLPSPAYAVRPLSDLAACF